MIGRPWLHLREVDSTNRRARALAAAGAPHGTLVTAEAQTEGRGRQGRAWVAPAGRALLLSVLVRGLDERHAVLPLAAAVAVSRSCERAAGVSAQIKWPNDVWIDGRKVAGILVEGRPHEGWAVIGVGLNVLTREEEFPADLRGAATSLAIAGGGSAPSVATVRSELVAALADQLAADAATTLAAWRQRDALLGSRVRWAGGEGIARGVSDAGALVVEAAAGRQELDAGEVHLLR